MRLPGFRAQLHSLPASTGTETVETLDLTDLPSFADHTYWGTFLAAPNGPDEVWFSLPTGSAAVSWLYIHNVRSGLTRRATKLAGDLRDASLLPSGMVAVLSMYALHEVTPDGRGLRSVRVPKYCGRLHPIFNGQLLAMSWFTTLPPPLSVPIVDAGTWTVEDRKRFPAIDAAIPDGGTELMCSFRAGSARRLDRNLAWVGHPIALPVATSALHSDGRTWCTPAREGRPVNVHPPGNTRTLVGDGEIAEIDLTGRTLGSGRIATGFKAWAPPPSPLLARDANGRLVVRLDERRVGLVDPDRLEIHATIEADADLISYCYVAPNSLVFRSSSVVVPRLHRLTWN